MPPVLLAQTADMISDGSTPEAVVVALDSWPLLLVAVVAPYLAIRIRDAAADHPDPDLGVKVAYHALLSLGVVLALAGLTALAGEWVERFTGLSPGASPPGPFLQQPPPRVYVRGPEQFSFFHPWALVTTGVTSAAGSAALIRLTTNVRRWPAVRRVFAGGRLFVTGLMVGAEVLNLNLIASHALAKNSSAFQGLSASLGSLGVWGVAFGFHVWLMRRYSRLPYYVGPDAE